MTQTTPIVWKTCPCCQDRVRGCFKCGCGAAARAAVKIPTNAKPCTEILTRDPLTGRARTARGYIRAGGKRLAEGVVWAGEDCCERALADACLLLAEKGKAA